MKLSDYKVGDSVMFYLHRSYQNGKAIDQLHTYPTNHISSNAIIHDILSDGSYIVRWDTTLPPCDGATILPLTYPPNRFGILTWEMRIGCPSICDVLLYFYGAQKVVSSTTATTPIVKQEQPCKQCQRKNSVGVSSCWWCCCPNPC